MKKACALGSSLLSLCLASNGWTIGSANISNEVPSARAAGQGYVGIAGQNDDPAAVYLNPAAMTKLLGSQVSIGATYENIHGKYEDNSGQETKAKVGNVVVPNLSMTHTSADGVLSFGLSVQTPFGLESHWGDGPLRYVATDSRLAIVDVTPAIAYQPSPLISVGVGADYFNVTNAQIDRHVSNDLLNGFATSGSPDAVSDLKGNGNAWGYHIGAMLQPTERQSLGLVYHSKAKIRLLGHVSLDQLGPGGSLIFGGSHYETSAYTDLTIPSNLGMGYAFKVTPQLTVEADAAWYHWSEQKDLNVRYSETSPFRLGVLTASNPEPLNLRDAWSFATGANYKVNDIWQVRTGFFYEPWAMPESTFNPAFLDLSRYGLSLGTGVALCKNLTLDFAYSAIFFGKRSINNNVGYSTSRITPGFGPNPDISGTYRNFTNLLAANVTLRFGGK